MRTRAGRPLRYGRRTGPKASGALVALSVTLAGGWLGACDTTKFAANSAADLVDRAAAAGPAHWDYELVGQALPGSILQHEGLLRVSPENDAIALQLAQAYVSYAFGWIEDELDRVPEDDFHEQERLQTRARLMYMRARNLAFSVVRRETEGFQPALEGGLDSLKRWLRAHCREPEQGPMLYWAGAAWGSAINVSREDPAMLADLGFATALVERAHVLDPAHADHGPATFLATVRSTFSESMGGDPEAGRRLFEQALTATGRRHHLVQLSYAESYAVTTGNRELYVKLLNEILEAPDQGNAYRLLNKIAKRRARRHLARIEDFFGESDAN